MDDHIIRFFANQAPTSQQAIEFSELIVTGIAPANFNDALNHVRDLVTHKVSQKRMRNVDT